LVSIDERAIAERFRLLSAQGVLDERGRRLWAAAEARAAGHGGITAVVRATGIAESTVLRGLADLDSGVEPLSAGKVRRHPGRVPILEREPGLESALERLVDPLTSGDLESPLRWTLKSSAILAAALVGLGHKVSERTVLRLLKDMGYSLQGNRKTREGAQRADRDAQFAHINATATTSLAACEPVIRVDARRRELAGDLQGVGGEFQHRDQPVELRDREPTVGEPGRAIPHRVRDLICDVGWVSVCVTRDTATTQFAVHSIRSWWEHLGRARYPHARTLTITADCGASTSGCARLWKLELARLAAEASLRIVVCHFPPGTSRWSRIEHRMFSLNSRGNPHERLEVVIELIAGTNATSGLTVYAQLDHARYPRAVKVADDEPAALPITTHAFHGEWNYEIRPPTSSS
jgi:hypothetical protein